MENQKYSSIAEAISRNTPTLFEPVQSSSVSGGCINQTSKLEGVDGRNFFVKQNDLDFLPFFKRSDCSAGNQRDRHHQGP